MREIVAVKEYFHYGCAAIVNDSAALRVVIDIETLSAFLQGGPAKVKPTYFTHQNVQTRYYSTVLFYKKNR